LHIAQIGQDARSMLALSRKAMAPRWPHYLLTPPELRLHFPDAPDCPHPLLFLGRNLIPYFSYFFRSSLPEQAVAQAPVAHVQLELAGGFS